MTTPAEQRAAAEREAREIVNAWHDGEYYWRDEDDKTRLVSHLADALLTREREAARVEREACKEFISELVEGKRDVLNLFDNAAYERDAADIRSRAKEERDE